MVKCVSMEKIKKNDVVYHVPSGLYYRCENGKHEKWMNSHPAYKKVSINEVPFGYFEKTSK